MFCTKDSTALLVILFLLYVEQHGKDILHEIYRISVVYVFVTEEDIF